MMLKKLLLFVFVIGLSDLLCAQSPKFELVFEDNFDRTELDSASWSKIPRGKSAWNKYMSTESSLYEVNNDVLTLYGRINDWVSLQYTSAYITEGVKRKGKKRKTSGRV